MSISNFNVYYKTYKKYLKSIKKNNNYYKPLVKTVLKKTGGRNNNGGITTYNRGGGVKRLYRSICFNYNLILEKSLINWIVERIEYDPNRTCNIALIKNMLVPPIYVNLSKHIYKYFIKVFYIYILAGISLKRGDFIGFFTKHNQYFPTKNQFTQLRNIFTGTKIFNIENRPLMGGKYARAAGTTCKLLKKYNKYGLVVLPSGIKKLLLLSCFATLGEGSNPLLLLKKDYKAGNSRWKNKRPCVRGVAKNPIDHPHGGGEGKTSGGRHPVSRWGILTKGYVTKRKKKKKKKRYV